MPVKIFLLIGVFVLGAAFSPAGTALAQDNAAGLMVEGAWARAASAGHTSAIYMTITNNGATAVEIVGGSTDVAETVEIHETTTEITFEDGKISQVMRMEAVDALSVAPGASVELKPGGLHMMLIGLTRAIEEGDSFAFTLQLSTGEQLVIDVPVTVGLGVDDDHHH